jgi:hypothetical protein
MSNLISGLVHMMKDTTSKKGKYQNDDIERIKFKISQKEFSYLMNFLFVGVTIVISA